MYYLFADLETYSACDIKKGSHRYAEDSSTELLLFGYAVGDAPAKVWDATVTPEMPDDLRQALDDVKAGKAKSVWHNGMNFDAVVLHYLGVVDLKPEDVIDTMVLAYEHGLPGSLADLSAIYKLDKDHAKDLDGKRLVQLFCKPRPEHMKLRRATRKTNPDDWARFVNYCRLDVEAERALFKLLPKFNVSKQERALQALDARINRRGMLMDMDLAHAALRYAEEEKARLRQKTAELTKGALDNAVRTEALRVYLNERFGMQLDNLQKSEVEKLINAEGIPEEMKELLRLRLTSAKAAVRKFKSVVDCANSDGRLRGTLQFRGAMRTGRFSGRLFQPQNLSRPTIKDWREIEGAIELAKHGLLEWAFPDVFDTLSNCLRGEIIVPAGKKMVVADYSNIEGRMLAWLAGETWKLQAFREFDAGTGPDLYKLTYSRAFNVLVGAVTKAQRQMGKVLELAMGYGGGAGAFVTFAKAYGIDLHVMADDVMPVVPQEIAEQAAKTWEWAKENKRTGGLDRRVFIACDSVKRMWRNANPHIVKFWYEAEEACVTALNEGRRVVFGQGRLAAERKGNWLTLRLPSGRYICYPSPQAGELGEGTNGFTYYGVNQYTRKWEKIGTYAGKIVENLTQAAAADVLCEALPRLEKAGYLPILTIHDEVLTEAPDTEAFNHNAMESLMCELPGWAQGLPLAAAGFDGYRYRKE